MKTMKKIIVLLHMVLISSMGFGQWISNENANNYELVKLKSLRFNSTGKNYSVNWQFGRDIAIHRNWEDPYYTDMFCFRTNLGMPFVFMGDDLRIEESLNIGPKNSRGIALGKSNPDVAPWIKSYLGFNISFNSVNDNWDVYANHSEGTNAIMTTGDRLKFVAIHRGALMGSNTISKEDVQKYIIMSMHNGQLITDPGSVILGTPERDVNLYVNGAVKARSIEVKLHTWSDFVFSKDFKLRTLLEVEQFIKDNNHLPDVPSEKEVLEDGISIGRMSAVLLQKIEELTLYIIEQDKRIKQLEEIVTD